ncbi:hypothetical protein R3P38DRAFT_3367678 [Favolaschia claudopus]|uniref:Uncharacterized protein n=1 Tax=Favolaschia claudopus TaxID=2862362 RepID=A0AAW0A743_9AGAR
MSHFSRPDWDARLRLATFCLRQLNSLGKVVATYPDSRHTKTTEFSTSPKPIKISGAWFNSAPAMVYGFKMPDKGCRILASKTTFSDKEIVKFWPQKPLFSDNPLVKLPGACQPWDHPKAVLAVQRYTPELPHLKDLTVTMLMGERVAWKRFSGEYTEDGAIAQATDEQMERAQMEKTNDRCESSFGVFRQEAKANPNMSLEVHNARQMFKFNGANRESKLLLARYKKEGAEVQMEKTRKRAAKKQAASDAIDRVVAILTVTELDWHAKYGPPLTPEQAKLIPNKSAQGNRENKVKLWVEAVQRYLEADLPRELRINPRTDPETPDDDEDPAEAVTVEDLGDTDSEKSGYDSEEDYYE